MGIRYGFDHKHDLALICLFIISSINVSANQRTIIFIDFSIDYDHYIIEINRNVTTEKGNTLEIQWKIGDGKNGYMLHDITTYATEGLLPISTWSRSTSTAEMTPEYHWKYLFHNRLKASYGNDIYKMIVENVTYTDSTQYSISGMLIKNGVFRRSFKSFVQVEVNGGPEFCEDNLSHETFESSAIQFTLCGYPAPEVFVVNDKKQQLQKLTVNAHVKKEYVNFFSLATEKSMCGETLRFLAIRESNKVKYWEKKFDLAFEATEISAVTQNRSNTSRNIYWVPVKYGKCNMHYVVKLYSGDELLLSDITNNTLYSFNSKHMNVTSFRIWAEMGKELKYSLPDKEEDYPDKHRRSSFFESLEGKVVIAGSGIMCLVLISFITSSIFCQKKRRCRTSREECQELVSGDSKNQIQNEASFDLQNTTGTGPVGNPYYSEIKHGSGSRALKSECKTPPECKKSLTVFADKNLMSENVTSYAKLGLINHSPYVGLGPINSPNKNLLSDNVTSYAKLDLINHSPYVGLGPINSSNQISSQKSTIRSFTAYAEIKEAVGKEGLQVESSIEVKDHSQNRSSISHNDSSYTKMESLHPASYTQSQIIKTDIVYQNDSLPFHAVGDFSTSNDSRYELSY